MPATVNEDAVAIPIDCVCPVTVVLYSIPLPDPGYALPVSSKNALTGVTKE